MPRGKRLPKEAIQDVPVLFPVGKVDPTPEQIEFYRRTIEKEGPYCFPIDRQSDGRELTREDHTGMVRRVEAILGMLDSGVKAWTPRPVWIEDRQKGQLPYVFDRSFWFLDGETKNATGYAANPNARPEFWRCYRLTLGLAERGCGPVAVVVGEYTRLFRDTDWLGTFYRSLSSVGVRVLFPGFGEVTDDNLRMLQAMIQAMSKPLREAASGARKARRRNSQIFHGKPRFGVEIDLDRNSDHYRKAVYAHPVEWPILSHLVHEMADGRLDSLSGAVEWLYDTYGVQRTFTWLQRLLQKDELLDGFYLTDKTEGTPRKLRQAPFEDLDITESGYRRYLIREKPEPLRIPINFEKYDLDPIPPEVLVRARAAIHGRGRPRTKERPEGCFLSGYHARCAVCDSALREVPPRPITPNWGLRCQCVDLVRMSKQYRNGGKPLSWATASAHPRCQHPRYAVLPRSFSQMVWDRLCRGMEEYSWDPADLTVPDEAAEERRLRDEIAALEAQLDSMFDQLMTVRLSPEALARWEERQNSLGAQLAEHRHALHTLSTTMIERRMQSETNRTFRRVLAAHNVSASDADKARLIDIIVRRVVVNLEERWYRIDTKGDLPTLLGLEGYLDEDGQALKSQQHPHSVSISLSLRGCLDDADARRAA